MTDERHINRKSSATQREKSHVHVVNLLLNRGAHVNAQNKRSETALMQALTERPEPEVVRALLKRHADVTLKDKEGRTALIWATGPNGDDKMKQIIQML